MASASRVSGAAGEKLLLVTGRISWKRVLAVGVGESEAFSENSFRVVVERTLEALRGIGAGSLAIALPGRDIDRIRPDRALREFLETLERSQEVNGHWLDRLTIIDAAPAAKAMSDAAHTRRAPDPDTVALP